MKQGIRLVVFILIVLIVWSAVFTVEETQFAVVTRFGNPLRVLEQPGLYFKWPSPIDRTVYLDRRLLTSDVPRADEPSREFLTKDKKNIEVASYVCWRVRDPRVFLQSIGTRREDADAALRDIVLSELGTVLGNHELDSLLSTEPGKMKLPEIMDHVRRTCAAVVSGGAGRAGEPGRDYGIEVVDFRIKRLNFPEQNRASVFERMRAERKRIATQYRSEGEKQAAIIRAEADRQSTEILADAYRRSQEIEGQADAEASRIYAQAYGQDPEFYEFLRSLQSYEHSLTKGTTFFLPADSPYLKWLQPVPLPVTTRPAAPAIPFGPTSRPADQRPLSEAVDGPRP